MWITSNQRQQQTQLGYTIIEVIIVIVILGVLAVSAHRVFFNQTSRAYQQALQNLKINIEAVSAETYARAIAQGKLGETAKLSNDLSLVYGYPKANPSSGEKGLTSVLSDLDPGYWTVTNQSQTGGGGEAELIISPAKAHDPSTCQLSYTNASHQGQKPTISIIDTGC